MVGHARNTFKHRYLGPICYRPDFGSGWSATLLEYPANQLSGMNAVTDHQLTVYHHVDDPYWRLNRVFIGRPVCYLVGIEYHQIGVLAFRKVRLEKEVEQIDRELAVLDSANQADDNSLKDWDSHEAVEKAKREAAEKEPPAE